jgi:hypothetical protein
MRIRFVVLSSLIVTMTAVSAAAEPALKIDLGKGVFLELVLVKKGQFRHGFARHRRRPRQR